MAYEGNIVEGLKWEWVKGYGLVGFEREWTSGFGMKGSGSDIVLVSVKKWEGEWKLGGNNFNSKTKEGITK